jgi:parallel beta-helix repeat protein
MIIGNTIKANTADDDGGGIYCRYASPTISNNIITGNTVADNGGGIFCRNSSSIITNNLITGNRAEDGGGIWLRDSSLLIANNTLTGNLAEDIGGGIGCRGNLAVSTATNSILWANTALNGYEIALRQGSTLTISYSDVQVRPAAFHLEEDCTLNLAENNINADPLFAEPGSWVDPNNPDIIVEPNDPCALWIDGDDYHLKSQGWRWGPLRNRWQWTWDDVTSRCIDAGNPGCQLGEEPLSIPGYPDRQYGVNLRINMGAYGGTTEASMGPHGWALLGDMTNDGIVNLKDLVLQASNWLASGSEQPDDLNRNRMVDLADLDLMTRDWLEQTSWYEP